MENEYIYIYEANMGCPVACNEIKHIQLLIMKEKSQINKIVRRQGDFSVVCTTVDQYMSALKT